MAKLDLDVLLTKIGSIFKKDAYIINNMYCIGGNESEEQKMTQIVLYMTPDAMAVLKEAFPDNDYVYIKNVKEAKKDLEKNVNYRIFESEKKDLQERLQNVLTEVNKSETWKNFEFSEEEADFIFNDGGSLELFGEDSGIPAVTVGKNLFPMVTVKRLETLFYDVHVPETSEELVSLITTMAMDYFQIYNLIQYIMI